MESFRIMKMSLWLPGTYIQHDTPLIFDSLSLLMITLKYRSHWSFNNSPFRSFKLTSFIPPTRLIHLIHSFDLSPLPSLPTSNGLVYSWGRNLLTAEEWDEQQAARQVPTPLVTPLDLFIICTLH